MMRRLLRRRADESLATWSCKLLFKVESAARSRRRRLEHRLRGPRRTTPAAWARAMEATSVEAALSRFVESRPSALAAFGVPGPFLLAELRRAHPREVGAAVEEAEEVLAGRYRVFGESYELGLEPDWSRDPRAGTRWSGFGPGIDVIRIDEPCDVRLLWELNRGHHLVRLAQAFLLTSDPRFASRATALARHWIEANPPSEGPNWSCAMEPALRAVNWIWLYHLLHGTGALEPAFLGVLLPALWDHGVFVERNLEGRAGLRNSNHYLADGLGLLYLGRFFEPARRARRWARLGAGILWDEMPRQVLADGVDHEMTTSYHRFVAEMYLHAWLLGRASETPPPSRVEAQLRQMVVFAAHYVRPDGAAPAWGDQDDGRVVPLAVAPARDHGHLLQAGRSLLGVPTPTPSPAGRFEVAWLTGLPQPEGPAARLGTRAFPQAGVYLLRSGTDYVFVDCGPYGAHGHADALSFELAAGGRPLIVDSGTFTYTRSVALRDAFRGTAAHNTVTIEGRDSSLLEANCLWGSRRGARVVVRLFDSDDARDVVEAEHDGYLDLPQRALHRRRFEFDKVRRSLLVHDDIAGSGEVEVVVHFHLAPDLQADAVGEGFSVRARSGGEELLALKARAPGLRGLLEPCEVSDRYGARDTATALRFKGRARLPFAAEFRLSLAREGR